MRDEPLPCPFCGHDGVTVHDGSTYRWVVAECDNCGACAGEVRRKRTNQYVLADEQQALAAWNTRGEAEE